jgi:hypothetical protein
MSTPGSPTAAPHVLAASEGDRTVLIDIVAERYYSLNRTGGRIWFLVGEGADLSTIAHVVAEEFSLPLVDAKADVSAFVAQLAAFGLVEQPPAGDAVQSSSLA